MYSFPHGVWCHVRSRGRRWGRAGKSPADCLRYQRWAIGEGEEDGVPELRGLTREEVVQERFDELHRRRGTREFGESGGGATDGKFLRRPHRLWGSCGQERGPVVPFGLLDGFEMMKLMESTEDEQNEEAITTDSKGSDQVREKR